MIEINLLPGAGRKKATTTTKSSFDFAAMSSGFSERFQDKVLIITMAILVVSLGTVGVLYWRQGSAKVAADARLEKAKADSVRYAGVVQLRATLQAKRDTVLRQVNLIRSIDEDRYVWPHILDEVSRVLPSYTWLTFLQFAGNPAGATNVVALPKPKPPPPPPPPDASGKRPPFVPPTVVPVSTTIPKDEITVRITGRTVDVQAMTRFWKDLEASPFLTDVQLENSTIGSELGKELNQFNLTMRYTRPDSTAIRRSPLVLTVR